MWQICQVDGTWGFRVGWRMAGLGVWKGSNALWWWRAKGMMCRAVVVGMAEKKVGQGWRALLSIWNGGDGLTSMHRVIDWALGGVQEGGVRDVTYGETRADVRRCTGYGGECSSVQSRMVIGCNHHSCKAQQRNMVWVLSSPHEAYANDNWSAHRCLEPRSSTTPHG
ncbi:uncharacterized protein EI97DRAFT_61511 [Westerdykella ornata]|uniref:Uncharacterized protein n=1 Tax=Westerdykella ornata TaxID=318751 RepID=A0A6A6JJ13_WESOR|nr:uncharacterized protein EI97DRAFT_61511 [Westerdykella ornata]KAF2275948.1 hypothetical protein EI97DRAFT_61511 [Westerdykella ornata]